MTKFVNPPNVAKYIAQIRNPAKKQYAIEYAAFIRNNGAIEPDTILIGTMAKQAVAMRLVELFKST